jgi:hypothetical protein
MFLVVLMKCLFSTPKMQSTQLSSHQYKGSQMLPSLQPPPIIPYSIIVLYPQLGKRFFSFQISFIPKVFDIISYPRMQPLATPSLCNGDLGSTQQFNKIFPSHSWISFVLSFLDLNIIIWPPILIFKTIIPYLKLCRAHTFILPMLYIVLS